MNAYKVSCYSHCGTYFASYLQSVTVLAHTERDAIEYVKIWLKENDRSFIRMDPTQWGVEVITHNTAVVGVIDYYEDSDY